MENVNKLKEHLSGRYLNHDFEIMKESTLKNAHIYCIVNNISAQQYGPLIEKYIITKCNYKKNHASECTGDCANGSVNIEVKASLGGATHNKFNYVQIRISQNINIYLLTAYHLTAENVENEGELYVFKIPKENMKDIIAKFGGYAHGTIKEHGVITSQSIEEDDNKKEYAIRPTFGSNCWKALLKYRDRDVI